MENILEKSAQSATQNTYSYQSVSTAIKHQYWSFGLKKNHALTSLDLKKHKCNIQYVHQHWLGFFTTKIF